MNSNLKGPFKLSKDEINRVVKGIGPGAYALGSLNSNELLIVKRIGRSDSDLNKRLHSYVGKYTYFKCDFFPSKKAAFEKECNLYHDFNPPDNKIHPDRPDDTSYSCPVDGCTL